MLLFTPVTTSLLLVTVAWWLTQPWPIPTVSTKTALEWGESCVSAIYIEATPSRKISISTKVNNSAETQNATVQHPVKISISTEVKDSTAKTQNATVRQPAEIQDTSAQVQDAEIQDAATKQKTKAAANELVQPTTSTSVFLISRTFSPTTGIAAATATWLEIFLSSFFSVCTLARYGKSYGAANADAATTTTTTTTTKQRSAGIYANSQKEGPSNSQNSPKTGKNGKIKVGWSSRFSSPNRFLPKTKIGGIVNCQKSLALPIFKSFSGSSFSPISFKKTSSISVSPKNFSFKKTSSISVSPASSSSISISVSTWISFSSPMFHASISSSLGRKLQEGGLQFSLRSQGMVPRMVSGRWKFVSRFRLVFGIHVRYQFRRIFGLRRRRKFRQRMYLCANANRRGKFIFVRFSISGRYAYDCKFRCNCKFRRWWSFFAGAAFCFSAAASQTNTTTTFFTVANRNETDTNDGNSDPDSNSSQHNSNANCEKNSAEENSGSSKIKIKMSTTSAASATNAAMVGTISAVFATTVSAATAATTTTGFHASHEIYAQLHTSVSMDASGMAIWTRAGILDATDVDPNEEKEEKEDDIWLLCLSVCILVIAVKRLRSKQVKAVATQIDLAETAEVGGTPAPVNQSTQVDGGTPNQSTQVDGGTPTLLYTTQSTPTQINATPTFTTTTTMTDLVNTDTTSMQIFGGVLTFSTSSTTTQFTTISTSVFSTTAFATTVCHGETLIW